MLRGHTAKEPQTPGPHALAERNRVPLQIYTNSPPIASLGRIRTGKRYGALPFRKGPARIDALRGMVTRTPQLDRLAAAMRFPIAIGLCSRGTTPLVNFVIIRPGPYNA